MKSNNGLLKGVPPLVFCFGMFLLAMCFSVVICCSTFYAFNSMKPDTQMAKSSHSNEAGNMKNIYASVK